jgi:hypothetical protein
VAWWEKENQMIPGRTSKLSEAILPVTPILDPKTDVVYLTGTGTITTIIPHYGGGFSGLLILIPQLEITFGTGGNIFQGITAPANRVVMLVYSKGLGQWIINTSQP